jgi:hypothetical protein
MGMTYAQASDVAQLEPAELSVRLVSALDEALEWLTEFSDADASRPEAEGKWSAKQVVGHLTDSAINNLGRVVRMQIVSGQSFAGYEQNDWVRLQHYQERDWTTVLELWKALNEQMAWTVAHVDKNSLSNVATIEGDELTLGYLIEDYIAHLEHHVVLLRGWVGLK